MTASSIVATRPRRYSLFLQVRTGEPTAAVYRRVIDIAVHAERLGFDTIWIAARHFGAHHAAVPSLFPLLAAVAQHTDRLRLGTGVVALPFENPVRLVEDAAVTDHLADGRIELGVGKGLGFGLSATTYAGFGLPGDDREDIYKRHLAEVHRLTATGEAAEGVVIHPDPTPLRARIWQSTGNADTARRAALAGDGLLPHANSEARRGAGPDELIDTYLEACGASTPRVAVTVGVLPGDVTRLLDTDRAISPAYYATTPIADDQQRYLREAHVTHGSDDEIIESVCATASLDRATELMFSVPLALHHPQFVETLEHLATRIAPVLTSPTTPVRRRNL